MAVQDRAKTVNDTLEGLTGYDEIAIAETFGKDVYALGGSTRLRALVWLERRRDPAATDQQAYDEVMAMRSADIADSFSDDVDEADTPDELDELADGLITPQELSPAGEGASSSD